MAINANALSVLVLSGEATFQDTISSEMKADIISDNIEKFGELLLAVKRE